MPSSVSQSSASAGLPPSSLAASACQSAKVFFGKSAISAFLPQLGDYSAASAASSIEPLSAQEVRPQADDADEDEIDRHDEVQEARNDEDEDAGDQRDERLKEHD